MIYKFQVFKFYGSHIEPYQKRDRSYGIDRYGHKTSNESDQDDDDDEYQRYHRYTRELVKFDIVTMEVNTMNKTMEFWVNDQSQGIAFKNIPFDDGVIYHFAVSLCTDETFYANSVKLLHFKQTVLNDE